jgi:acyl-CoA thioesterase-2
MPKAPPPLSVPTEQEAMLAIIDKVPPVFHERIRAPRPFEMRPIGDPLDLLHPRAQPPRKMVWLKAVDKLPDNPALHHYLLAYVSDHWFIGTALLPHEVTFWTRGMQVASLDHVMWFHRPFRVDEWLLHVMDSPNAHGGRGLVRGQLFTEDGRLVASTSQEGLIRRRTKT